MGLRDGGRPIAGILPAFLVTALLAAALLALTSLTASAETEEPGASKAAQRTISLGNFIVNRDVIGLRGGRTTTVFAGCPGKTRFFTFGFRPFGIQRGAPRVNFLVTAIVPRPNGVSIRFQNPAALNSFPVNIRVSVMCLTLGTVSAAAAAGERAATVSSDSAVAAKKKKAKKSKPKLKSRVVVKKVKVGAKKKKKRKKKGKAASSAAAQSAAVVSTNVGATCDSQRNEIPGAFGFESGRSEFSGAAPFRSAGDVGLRGTFHTDGADTLKFHLVCLQGQGVAMRSAIGGTAAGAARASDGLARSAAGGPVAVLILNHGPPSGPGAPVGDGVFGDGPLFNIPYSPLGFSGSAPMPPVPAMPPMPHDLTNPASWTTSAGAPPVASINNLDGGRGLLTTRSNISATYSELDLRGIAYEQMGTLEPVTMDLFAPVNGMTAPPATQDATCNFSGRAGDFIDWDCTPHQPVDMTFRLQDHPDNVGKTIIAETIDSPGCSIDGDMRGVTCTGPPNMMGTAAFIFSGGAMTTPMMGMVGFPPSLGGPDAWSATTTS